MKLTNDLLVIDLEATEDHEQVIDIGAVRLDRNLEVTGEFSSLVNPGRPLTPFIVELTGIDDGMLADADPFPEVARRFLDWIEEEGRVKKVRLCAWGTYFDIPLLRRAFAAHGLDYPFPGTAYDVKTLAFAWAALSGRRADRLDVTTVARWLGVPLPDRMHRGIADARAEAEITRRVLRQMGSGMWLDHPKGTFRLEISSSDVNR